MRCIFCQESAFQVQNIFQIELSSAQVVAELVAELSNIILNTFFQTTNRIILVSAKKLARSVAVVVRCNKFEKRKMKKSFYSLSKKVLSFARFPKSSKFKKRNSFLENENHACFALFSQKSCTITGFFRNFLKRLICAGKVAIYLVI